MKLAYIHVVISSSVKSSAQASNKSDRTTVEIKTDMAVRQKGLFLGVRLALQKLWSVDIDL